MPLIFLLGTKKLKTLLEDKWGVKASAAAVVAAQPVAGGSAGEAAEEGDYAAEEGHDEL